MLFLKVLNGKEKDVFQSARILSLKKVILYFKKKDVQNTSRLVSKVFFNKDNRFDNKISQPSCGF
jgi:hypothetical protein